MREGNEGLGSGILAANVKFILVCQEKKAQ